MVTGVLIFGVLAGAAVAEVVRRLTNRGPGVSPTPLRPTTVTIPDPITPAKDEAQAAEAEPVSSDETHGLTRAGPDGSDSGPVLRQQQGEVVTELGGPCSPAAAAAPRPARVSTGA